MTNHWERLYLYLYSDLCLQLLITETALIPVLEPFKQKKKKKKEGGTKDDTYTL